MTTHPCHCRYYGQAFLAAYRTNCPDCGAALDDDEQ